MKLQTVTCPRCGKTFAQNSYNHVHCVICAAEIHIEKNVAKARAKRLAAKEQQS